MDYSATLYNIGVVYAPNLQHELYASFSQGFELPDIGLQVRNARANFDIGSSDLKPVEVDNYEIGWRGQFEQASASLAFFQSRSRLGGVQSFNNGLILSRTRERIEGVEAQLDFTSLDQRWGSGASLTWLQGRERPKGGHDRDMTGYRIPPLKLTAYLEYAPLDEWRSRLRQPISRGATTAWMGWKASVVAKWTAIPWSTCSAAIAWTSTTASR